MSATELRSVSAVVLAWGEEPMLAECVQSLLASRDVVIDVTVIDNGAAADDVDQVRRLDHVRVLTPGRNLGFAGGCNLGAQQASGDVLLFLNSDAVVDADCVARLAAELDSDVGLVCASVRLWQRRDVLNSAGNPWHYSGLVWAGGLDEPASSHADNCDVMCASGATMAITTADWTQLGGFDDAYFAYHEDAELSLRVWQRGKRVRYIADAVSYHHYEFSRNAAKEYLLERNRLMTVLTHYQLRTLVVLSPILLLLELAISAAATAQGWGGRKFAGYWWLLRNAKLVRTRRRLVQSARVVSDRDLAPRFAASIDAAVLGNGVAIRMLNGLLRAYWALARRLI